MKEDVPFTLRRPSGGDLSGQDSENEKKTGLRGKSFLLIWGRGGRGQV